MFNFIGKTVQVLHLWHGKERKHIHVGTVLLAKPTTRGRVMLTWKDPITGKHFIGEKEGHYVKNT